jgi:hypothetical protein
MSICIDCLRFHDSSPDDPTTSGRFIGMKGCSSHRLDAIDPGLADDEVVGVVMFDIAE